MITTVIIFMNLPLALQSEQGAVHPLPLPIGAGAYTAQVLWALSANAAGK